MTSTATLSWSDANQRLLAAELDRIKTLLSAEPQDDAARAALAESRRDMPERSAIDQLTRSFGLSEFERDLLLLCAGAELDAAIGEQCARYHNDARRKYATFGLALAQFEGPHWSALAPVRPLRRWRLIEQDDSEGLTQARLRIDERVLHYIAGVNYLDPRLNSLLRLHPVPAAIANSHRQICDGLLRSLEEADGTLPLLQFIGDDSNGQADIAAAAAEALGLTLHVMRAEDISQNHNELEALAVLCGREAELLGTSFLIQCGDTTPPKTVARLAGRLGCLVFLAGKEGVRCERAALRFDVNKPGPSDQKRLWEAALGPAAARLNGALDAAASQFRLSASDIQEQVTLLSPALVASSDPGGLLWGTCRRLGQARLDELAQRIEPAARWDDLILPGEQTVTLRQITAHAKQRLKVYEDWGFAAKGSRGLGISALFAGESGTGKTMAAEVLANELNLDLFRIDLSAVVSKYIGETEKNLRRVFDAAEDCGAVLLFDEADALFGKRSEVKDSHDRYANIEVSYLLQRMESYRGLAILTTNFKTALDAAFQRRLSFVVNFPFPDQELREAIWRRVFPSAAPLGDLDYSRLARLQVAGGNIRNIALNAAFIAASAGEAVSMQHLLRAAHLESSKRERHLADAETRGWV